ncbi:MAG: toxin-antitoxin system HicB family antitoxin [Planctomycetes bacterium]|nr:toxin-antitoxin system HicB family antitoxin [Planctomycetota bacterium]
MTERVQPGREAPEEPEDSGRKAFLLRLSPELHAELRAWAAQELRSLNAHIEWLLREAVKRRRSR